MLEQTPPRLVLRPWNNLATGEKVQPRSLKKG